MDATTTNRAGRAAQRVPERWAPTSPSTGRTSMRSTRRSPRTRRVFETEERRLLRFRDGQRTHPTVNRLAGRWVAVSSPLRRRGAARPRSCFRRRGAVRPHDVACVDGRRPGLRRGPPGARSAASPGAVRTLERGGGGLAPSDCRRGGRGRHRQGVDRGASPPRGVPGARGRWSPRWVSRSWVTLLAGDPDRRPRRPSKDRWPRSDRGALATSSVTKRSWGPGLRHVMVGCADAIRHRAGHRVGRRRAPRPRCWPPGRCCAGPTHQHSVGRPRRLQRRRHRELRPGDDPVTNWNLLRAADRRLSDALPGGCLGAGGDHLSKRISKASVQPVPPHGDDRLGLHLPRCSDRRVHAVRAARPDPAAALGVSSDPDRLGDRGDVRHGGDRGLVVATQAHRRAHSAGDPPGGRARLPPWRSATWDGHEPAWDGRDVGTWRDFG